MEQLCPWIFLFFCVCVLRVCVCTCYLISPESAAHPMDPVGKGGVEGCLLLCVNAKGRNRVIEGAIFLL